MSLENLLSTWQITSIDPRAITVGLFLFGCFMVYKMIADGDWLAKLIGVGLLLLAFRIFVI